MIRLFFKQILDDFCFKKTIENLKYDFTIFIIVKIISWEKTIFALKFPNIILFLKSFLNYL